MTSSFNFVATRGKTTYIQELTPKMPILTLPDWEPAGPQADSSELQDTWT